MTKPHFPSSIKDVFFLSAVQPCFSGSLSVSELAVNSRCGVPVSETLDKSLRFEIEAPPSPFGAKVCSQTAGVGVCLPCQSESESSYASIYIFPDCCTRESVHILLTSTPSLSSFLLFVSFTLFLASVQVLAVVSFRKCTACCWEARYLPLGQSTFYFFFFFSFRLIFIGCLREAELLRARRSLNPCMLFGLLDKY